jgi:16S rRNA processing protein RimM
LVRFTQCPDRSSVEALAGVTLEADVDVCAPGGDPDEFHDLALVGLSVTAPDGSRLGSVVGVVHLPGQDLLEIAASRSADEPFLVPFVHALVPVVDIAGGRIVVDLPAGLVAGGAGNSSEDEAVAGESGSAGAASR